MDFRFEVLKTDPSGARLGRLETPHGVIETPAFMPVGTLGTVKGLTQESLEALGARIILANTYHLYLRPGAELIREMGGLHKFMAWPHPILTDSGGYQVFSLSDLRKVTDEGVTFRSHIDGSEHSLSPERAIEIQLALGSDIMMVLDECIEASSSEGRAAAAAARTLAWARRSRDYFSEHDDAQRQIMFGIVQGGAHAELRRKSADETVELDFPGYAIGGLAVGESHEVTCAMTQAAAGRLLIRNAQYARDPRPIDENCACAVCRRYSRAYLRHLYATGEFLATILNTHHNLYFYLDIMGKIREAIRFGKLGRLRSDLQARLT